MDIEWNLLTCQVCRKIFSSPASLVLTPSLCIKARLGGKAPHCECLRNLTNSLYVETFKFGQRHLLNEMTSWKDFEMFQLDS
jgi:hypothetical protein